MGQKVLVIGSGAREHTIAYTLLKAPSIDEVTVAPGNPGMLKDGMRSSRRARVGALMMRPALRGLKNKMDYKSHGGARHPHHAAEPVESRRTYRIREEQWL